MICLERVISLKDLKKGQRLAVANSTTLHNTVMKNTNVNLAFFNVDKVTEENDDIRVYVSDEKRVNVLVIANEFFRQNELYVVKIRPDSDKKELDLRQENIALNKQLRKAEKLAKKYKGYARLGKIMPGVAPEKKAKGKVFISEIDANTHLGLFKVKTYKSNRTIICEVYSQDDKLLGVGEARCHEGDSFIIERGVELAGARALTKAFETLF